jgi:hypothetical protein
MRKALLIVLATMFVAGFAYGKDKDFIGVYFDTGHSLCSTTASGDTYFYYYVFGRPQLRGLMAVEFKIVFPAMVYDFGSMTLNEDINLTLGDIQTGWSATFVQCMHEWIQIYRQRVYVDTSIAPNGVIRIMPSDDSSNLGLSTCEMQDAPFTVLNHGFINLPCIIGTQSASWGAIKSLF